MPFQVVKGYSCQQTAGMVFLLRMLSSQHSRKDAVMDETTLLYLIAFGAALHGDSDALDRIKGSAMTSDMKRAFRELRETREVGPALRRWMAQMKVDTSNGVLEGVLRRLEGKEKTHAERLTEWRDAFERLMG